MDDVELSRYAAEAFRHMDQAPHPSIEQVAEFAAGELSGSVRGEVDKHLAACDLCRNRLQEYEQFVVDSERPASKDLSREWGELSRRIRWHKVALTVPRWRAYAADVLAVAGVSWLLIGLLTPSPAQLLARAYHEQRRYDIRLAGAQYSKVRRQRGADSALSNPASLLRAGARLTEQVKSNPDDPEVLRLNAEAEMMFGQPAAAIQTLEKARDLQPQNALILADLGAAYCLRGDLEKQFGDYMIAIDCLGESLHLKPRVREVIFNLALALEKGMLKDQAIEEWKEYLKLDSTSGWADEARQHLSELQAAIDERDDALLRQTADDPSQFLALLAAGSPVDAEAYLRDVAITKWLPLGASGGPAREATMHLAQILKERHGDYWLADMADSGAGTEMLSGLQKLAAARNGNLHGGDMEAALTSALEAQQNFLRARSWCGDVGARFAEITSLLGLLHHDECLAKADELIRDLETHPYSWLRAQLEIQSAVCLMRLGRLGEAAIHLRRATEMSRAADFGISALTANNMHLACVRHIGLPSQVFASAQQSLRAFWNGTYPPKLFHQVVDELRDIATRSEQRYAAWFLARGEVWAAKATVDPRVEAPALANLAVAAQAVGEANEARANLALSDQLFGKIPPGYRWEPQISLASVEMEERDVDAALTRLEKLRSSGEPPPSVLVEVLFDYALGEARRRKGLLPLAVEAFRKGIDQGTRRVASLSSESERSGVLETIENSYRGLVAATLDSSGESTEGLRAWQSFRALDGVGNLSDVRQAVNPVLWFVELRDGFACWLSRHDQVISQRIIAPKEPVAVVVDRFRRECSDAASPGGRVREDAQQLYQWMVEPFAAQLGEHDNDLVFELDGVLRGVPVQALMTRDGGYLGDRFALQVSSGCAAAQRANLPRLNARVVIIANPAVVGESAARFPPLPESVEEAGALRTIFPNTAVLEGPAATIDALVALLPTADIVHFAGHGYTNSENGELLFAPKDPKSSDCDVLRSSDLRRQDWSRCRLAVLSACRAASGETRAAHNPDSLVRGLTKAGVSDVVASLWDVDSAATAELMKAFYASLAAGASPGQALRAGQEQVRKHAGWDHAYYWAGFQLYGTT